MYGCECRKGPAGKHALASSAMSDDERSATVRRPRGAAMLLAGVLLGIAGAAQGAGLAMLSRLEAGQWEIRARDGKGTAASLCIADGNGLVQIRHAGASCRSFVVEDTPLAVTVHYTCPGNGYGRTRIRLESARLAQVETQGIAGGLPFDDTVEARRTGSCTPDRR